MNTKRDEFYCKIKFKIKETYCKPQNNFKLFFDMYRLSIAWKNDIIITHICDNF